MSVRKIFLIALGFVYFILLFGFGAGFIYCVNAVPGDPNDIELLYFGVGLCSLPFILMLGACVGFYVDLHTELRKDDY